MPEEYSLYEAKSKLSALVRQVREGSTIIITVHGEPVAELRPFEKVERTLSPAEKLADLEARGELLPAVRKPGEKLGIRSVARRPGALKRFLEERD